MFSQSNGRVRFEILIRHGSGKANYGFPLVEKCRAGASFTSSCFFFLLTFSFSGLNHVIQKQLAKSKVDYWVPNNEVTRGTL